MSANTGIAWTDHTFNPWWGCVKVSPGCTNCYAEAWDARWKGNHWGKDAPRRFFGAAHWNEPVKWNRAAEMEGRKHRVFCASMADVFEDRRDLDNERHELWDLILRTPHLDWQLLTKRPENVAKMLPWGEYGAGPTPWRNVWIGTTVEDQKRADERIPELLKVPAVVRFLSCEPLLEPLDLPMGNLSDDGIGWVIVGGESGGNARAFNVDWARNIVANCKAAGVPVFVKQLGASIEWYGCAGPGEAWPRHTETQDTGRGCFRVVLNHSHGGDPAEWPDDLRVRGFPRQLPLEGPDRDPGEAA